MKKHGKQIHVVVDGLGRGVIYVSGEISFREMARGACALRGVKKDLRAKGVAGWGFDGANFYVTTRRKKVRSFSPNFQWFVTAKGGASPKMDLGFNPFQEILKNPPR